MARIHQLFRQLKEQSGSDLHLAAGLPPRIRTHGELEDVAGWEVLTDEDLLAIPCLLGKKSEGEKFAGAKYTLSCEAFLPIGKAIQFSYDYGGRLSCSRQRPWPGLTKGHGSRCQNDNQA